jgi:lysine decarboxylase
VNDALPTISPTYVVRHAYHGGGVVPADEAVGLVAAERIEAYPPGIAVVFEGFRVTAEALAWLRAVKRCGGSVRGRDESLESLRVLPEGSL